MKDQSVGEKTLSKQKKDQEELVDLPEQAPQSPWKQYVFTPRFLILFAAALFFVGRNFYIEYTKDPKVLTQSQQQIQAKQEQIAPELYNRFFWYIILTIVFFTVWILLKRSNDVAEEQKIREEIRIQEEQDEKKKKIQVKANKIITSMDQFGNVVDEKALNQIKQTKDESLKIKKDD